MRALEYTRHLFILLAGSNVARSCSRWKRGEVSFSRMFSSRYDVLYYFFIFKERLRLFLEDLSRRRKFIFTFKWKILLLFFFFFTNIWRFYKYIAKLTSYQISRGRFKKKIFRSETRIKRLRLSKGATKKLEGAINDNFNFFRENGKS